MNLQIGNTYQVTVTEILPIGAVVTMEDNTTELIHISNIADCFVRNVGDYVSVGHSYTATCKEGKVHPAELSLIPLHLEENVPDKPNNRNRRKY